MYYIANSRPRSHTLVALAVASVLAATSTAALAGARPDLTIASPKPGTVVHSPVQLVIYLTNAKIGRPVTGLDHLHISIDHGPVMADYKSTFLSIALPPGKHLIAVELAGPTHAPLLPWKTVQVTVKP